MQFLDAQVRVKQAMTIVLFVHLTTISLTRIIANQIWVFVREIVIKKLIVLHASNVSRGPDSHPCVGVKVQGYVDETTVSPEQPHHLPNR